MCVSVCEVERESFDPIKSSIKTMALTHFTHVTPTSHRLSDNSKNGMEWPWQTNDMKLPQKKRRFFFSTQLEIASISGSISPILTGLTKGKGGAWQKISHSVSQTIVLKFHYKIKVIPMDVTIGLIAVIWHI